MNFIFVKLVVLFICCVFVNKSQGASIPKTQKSIDEILMEANSHSVQMLDLFHDLGDGQLMMVVELDIMMNASQLAEYRSTNNRFKRKAYKNERLRWPDRMVPYQISNDFDTTERNTIREGIADWENYTCLSFREVQPFEESQFPSRILFRDGNGCYSRLGRTGTVQPISLGRGCRTRGIVVHEIGHAIGWIHEQARPDRDEYITINFNQIPTSWRPQYRKSSEDTINDFDVEYDYTSIMHYSANSFGPRTIVTRDPAFQNLIGQRQALSFRDVKLANLMYSCAERGMCPRRQCPGEGFQGKDCRCYCPTENIDLSVPVVPCDMTAPPITVRPTQAPTTRPPRVTTTTAQTTQECRDMLPVQNCDRIRDLGGCEADPARTMIYCQKTCGYCEEDPDDMCMDFDDACPFIANSGYCNRSSAFAEIVLATCPKSCKVCTPSKDSCQGQFIRRDTGNHGNSIYSYPVTMVMSLFVIVNFVHL